MDQKLSPLITNPQLNYHPLNWFYVWLHIMFCPKIETFAAFVVHKNANPLYAFIWVGLSTFLLLTIDGEFKAFRARDLTDIDKVLLVLFSTLAAFFYSCLAIFYLWLSVAVVKSIAEKIRGVADFRNLAYLIGVVLVPFMSLTPLILFYVIELSDMKLISVILLIIQSVITVYTFMLHTIAVKAVTKLKWSQSIWLSFLAMLVGLALFACFLLCALFGVA